MAGFMQMSFPMGGLNSSPFPNSDLQCHHPVGVPTSHWSFLPPQNGYTHIQSQQSAFSSMSRKRTSAQAFACTGHELVKRTRPEDMSLGHPIQQAANMQLGSQMSFLSNSTTAAEQACSFPSSFMEHQNVVHAERKYQSSLLEELLYEVHGC